MLAKTFQQPVASRRLLRACCPRLVSLTDKESGAYPDVRRLRAIEVNAGTGLPGLVLAARGATVDQTDIPAVLQLLRRNQDRNAKLVATGAGLLRAWPLSWAQVTCAATADGGEQPRPCWWPQTAAVATWSPPQLALCVDALYIACKYHEEATLATCVANLAQITGAAGGSVLFCYQQRDASAERAFLQRLVDLGVGVVDVSAYLEPLAAEEHPLGSTAGYEVVHDLFHGENVAESGVHAFVCTRGEASGAKGVGNERSQDTAKHACCD